MATIKLTNSVLLSSESLAVGIDTSNVLATIVSTGGSSSADNFEYTAETQDCWVSFFAQGGRSVYIDSILVDCIDSSGSTAVRSFFVFLKKGQKISFYGNSASKRALVFGLK